jgi:hypothetical protein
MAKAGGKIAVTERAALARCRRMLASTRDWRLRVARSERAEQSVGARFYAIDDGNCVAHKWADLADLVSWCGALKPWEILES